MPPDSLDLQPPRVSGYGRVTASVDSAGRRLDVAPRDGFWARLDSRAGAAYGWTERLWSGGGTWTTPVGARSGTTSVNPAYDLNGGVTATPGVIVWMTRGAWGGNTAGQDYRFSSCCVGTGSGSGSGSGTVATPCCDSIPQTLYGTISGLPNPDCAMFNSVAATMTYNPGTLLGATAGYWQGRFTEAGGHYMDLAIACASLGSGCGSIFVSLTGSSPLASTFTGGFASPCTCDPFYAVFSFSVVGFTCSLGTDVGNGTLTVTE